MVFVDLVLASLLAWCLWVLYEISFDFFVGFCAYGVAMVVDCCREFVGFMVVGVCRGGWGGFYCGEDVVGLRWFFVLGFRC